MTHRRAVALVAAAISSLCSACSPNAPVNPDQFEVIVDTADQNTVRMLWTGSIDPPMARLIAGEFDRRKETTKTFIIDLHSPGGSVDEGERVIKAIQKMRATHSIRTYVGAGNDCLSMCVPIYLQGELRIAAATSNFMFHEPSANDSLTGDAVFTYEFENRQMAMEIFNRFFKNSEMDPRWRKRLQEQVRLGEVWKTGGELKLERSKIVTIVEEG